MEDFQLPEDLVDNIKSYFKVPQANEPCGALIIVKGKLRFKPLKNSSLVQDTFILDPIEYVSINRNIFILIHGHPTDCAPSVHDIAQADLHNIPYMIFNLSNMEYSIYWPKNYLRLCGRSYNFGIDDCFEACRKWYSIHGVFTPSRNPNWQDDWWLSGQDYIGEEINKWPFIPTDSMKYGDLLVFTMGADVPNHLGVYLDEDMFFHHAGNRLSCKEELLPMWGKHITGIYRHETSSIRRISWGEIW